MGDLRRSRARLVLAHPWLATLILRLEVVATDRPDIETAATDGRRILYAPAYVAALTQDETDGLYAHEALHCGLLHTMRREGRDPRRWNVACDVVVNPILIDAGLTLPNGGLLPATVGLSAYAGESAEIVYDQLPASAGKRAGGYGEVIDGPAAAALADEWRQALAEAWTLARQQGVQSAGLDRAVPETLAPKLDWRDILTAHLQRVRSGGDYSYARPSRRGRALGAILPGLVDDGCQPLGVCIDTSGSMSAEEIANSLAIVRSLCEQLRIERLALVQADAAVCGPIVEIGAGEELPAITIRGGGGTNFGPAIAACGALDVAAVLYLTDMAGAFPDREPSAPVIWLTYTRAATAPYGHVVIINR